MKRVKKEELDSEGVISQDLQILKVSNFSLAPLVHAYNPSYLGGW
jgi:hypothetical protein